MAIEELEGLLLEDEEEEGEVDLEGELRSALEEIDRLKMKCKKKKGHSSHVCKRRKQLRSPHAAKARA